MSAPRITVEELKRKLDEGAGLLLLDVRNPKAWAGSDVKLPGAVRIPMAEFDLRSGELDSTKEVVAYCT